MFAAVIGLAALTWFADKTDLSNNKNMTNKSGDSIHVKDPYLPRELGYTRELSSRLPWGADRTTHIGEINLNNPTPYINVLPGGENTNVTNMRQAVLPEQLKKFRRLVNQRENLEEYWLFDNYLGDTFANQTALHRDSSIAYRYE